MNRSNNDDEQTIMIIHNILFSSGTLIGQVPDLPVLFLNVFFFLYLFHLLLPLFYNLGNFF